MQNPHRPAVPSSASPPGSPALSAHPRAAAEPTGAWLSHKGAGLGLPCTGNILFSRWGRKRSGKDTAALHSWLRILGILGGSPASCLSLSLLGALAQCHSVLAAEQCPTWGAPWIWGDRGHSLTSPTHPSYSRSRQTPTRKERTGGPGSSQSTREGFLLSVLPCRAPSLPPSSGKWPGDRVDGWGGKRPRQPLSVAGTQFLHLQNGRLVSILSAAALWSPSGNCLSAEPLPWPDAGYRGSHCLFIWANSLRSHGLPAPRLQELETPQSPVVRPRSLLPGCAWASREGNDSSRIPRGQVELTLDPVCLLLLPRATRAEFILHAFLQPLVSAV